MYRWLKRREGSNLEEIQDVEAFKARMTQVCRGSAVSALCLCFWCVVPVVFLSLKCSFSLHLLLYYCRMLVACFVLCERSFLWGFSWLQFLYSRAVLFVVSFFFLCAVRICTLTVCVCAVKNVCLAIHVWCGVLIATRHGVQLAAHTLQVNQTTMFGVFIESSTAEVEGFRMAAEMSDQPFVMTILTDPTVLPGNPPYALVIKKVCGVIAGVANFRDSA